MKVQTSTHYLTKSFVNIVDQKKGRVVGYVVRAPVQWSGQPPTCESKIRNDGGYKLFFIKDKGKFGL